MQSWNTAETGTFADPSGNKHPRIAPHGIYPTADDHWIVIAIDDDAVFSRFAAGSGHQG